ncbi:hypothetical protein [Phenylobacterium sp.]|uniref:hypothetical protein n=1 Tax=Phenylobacterium sp. TaxID=1871053 RepID=UPI0025EDEECC|nr:hypothetical protein [Phenylobacterium sp.]MBX3486023.1 hypothetical protein [Phenylobacterium sp.]MCW5760230.1 hypothetical protein [Phenylobacterium sp.]
MSDPNLEGEDFRKARRARNIAIALGLAVFVILVYAVTIVNLGSDVIHRPL